MSRSMAYFKSTAGTIKRNELNISVKPKCSEEWLQRAKETNTRISKKYARYSIVRSV